MVCGGVFVSEGKRKFGLARSRWTKYCCGVYWLKNWKQAGTGGSAPLNCPRPSEGRLPLFGFGVLFGHREGGAPNCRPGSVIERAGSAGGMGSGSTKTWAGCAWVSPDFGMRTPALVIKPILMRSRRVKPSFTSSRRLLRACCSSLSLLRFLFEKCAIGELLSDGPRRAGVHRRG